MALLSRNLGCRTAFLAAVACTFAQLVLAAASTTNDAAGLTLCMTNTSFAISAFGGYPCAASGISVPVVDTAKLPGTTVSYAWTGTLTPPSSDNFTFYAQLMGHARVRVDDHLILDCDARGAISAVNCSAFYSIPLPFFTSHASVILIEFTPDSASNASLFSITVCASNASCIPLPQSWMNATLPPAEEAYLTARAAAEVGWNTWYSSDMFTQVLLPSGASVAATVVTAGGAVLADVGSDGPRCDDSLYPVRNGLHDVRGAYSDVTNITWGGALLRLQSASMNSDRDVVMLMTVLQVNSSVAGQLWSVNVTGGTPPEWAPRVCTGGAAPSGIQVACAGFDTILVRAASYSNSSVVNGSILLQLPMSVGASVAWYTGTGSPITVADAVTLIGASRAALLARIAGASGGHDDTYAGALAAIGWNVVFTPYDYIVAPVFRGNPWKLSPHGEVLFLWDTLLSAWIAAAVGDTWTALSNAIRIVKTLTKDGYILGFWEGMCGELNSNPPLASLTVAFLSSVAPTPWLEPLLAEQLLMFNQWMMSARGVASMISPGSHTLSPGLACATESYPNLTGARYETGLDNSPLFDSASWVAETHTMNEVDAGMSGMYAADAVALTGIMQRINRSDWAAAVADRAGSVEDAMHDNLWGGSDAPLWFNRHFYVNGSGDRILNTTVNVVAPTNFYPMMTGASQLERVEACVARYLTNASEMCVNMTATTCGSLPSLPSVSRSSPTFVDNNYWRGRAWGPMIFLTYASLTPYVGASPIVAAARADLAAQAEAVFLHNWLNYGHVMENFNSQTGEGCDVSNALPFYHWGALNALVALMEAGVAPGPPTMMRV